MVGYPQETVLQNEMASWVMAWECDSRGALDPQPGNEPLTSQALLHKIHWTQKCGVTIHNQLFSNGISPAQGICQISTSPNGLVSGCPRVFCLSPTYASSRRFRLACRRARGRPLGVRRGHFEQLHNMTVRIYVLYRSVQV